MKVRMMRREYAAGVAAAKAAKMTFARWAANVTRRYLKQEAEGAVMASGELSRKESVSVYVGCKDVPGEIVRRAVAAAVVQQEDILWNYRWRKDVLDLVIYVRGFEGEKIGYDEAEKFMDERLEARKRELKNARIRKCGNGDRAVARKNRREIKEAQ